MSCTKMVKKRENQQWIQELKKKREKKQYLSIFVVWILEICNYLPLTQETSLCFTVTRCRFRYPLCFTNKKKNNKHRNNCYTPVRIRWTVCYSGCWLNDSWLRPNIIFFFLFSFFSTKYIFCACIHSSYM